MAKSHLALVGILVISVFYYAQAQSSTSTTAKPTTAPDLGACKLPADSGDCRAAFTRYHYDMQTGKCSRFTYGGCDGNANRFRTLEECEAYGKQCQQQASG